MAALCTGGIPTTPAGRFGHSFAVEEVNNDDFADLVVGASDTTELVQVGNSERNAHGRVYIFLGHPHFFDAQYPAGSGTPGYLYRWIAIRAPQTIVDPTVQPFVVNGEFGLSVDAADLDADGLSEVLAGRAERELDRGRAHLFNGRWIKEQIDANLPPFVPVQPSCGAVVSPPATDDKDVGVPDAYETLIDTTETGNHAFGFNVFMLRDDAGVWLGDTFDGKPDIAIYSDKADLLDVCGNTVVPLAGALFVFFNDSDGTGYGSLVAEQHGYGIKLQTPAQDGGVFVPPYDPPLCPPPCPRAQNYARFGFVGAVVNWASTLSGSPVLGKYLLVGEPDATVTLDPCQPGFVNRHEGRAFLLELPLKVTSGGGAHPNALAAPLIAPASEGGPQEFGQYAHWLAVGNYLTTNLGDEIVISERGKDLGQGLEGAGQAYAYRAGP